MFANTAIFSILVTAVTSVMTSAAAAPYIAPTTLPDASEWNHKPFNATAYFESAELEAQDKAHHNHPKRNIPGVYMCEHANWGWPCWWQPAVGQCIHTSGEEISIGPDSGVYCSTYGNNNCANDAVWNNFQKPGYWLNVHAPSFKCQTSWIET